MNKPIMVEIQDARADGSTMWLVSWGGPNPEGKDCAEVVSAEEAQKIIDYWQESIESESTRWLRVQHAFAAAIEQALRNVGLTWGEVFNSGR